MWDIVILQLNQELKVQAFPGVGIRPTDAQDACYDGRLIDICCFRGFAQRVTFKMRSKSARVKIKAKAHHFVMIRTPFCGLLRTGCRSYSWWLLAFVFGHPDRDLGLVATSGLNVAAWMDSRDSIESKMKKGRWVKGELISLGNTLVELSRVNLERRKRKAELIAEAYFSNSRTERDGVGDWRANESNAQRVQRTCLYCFIAKSPLKVLGNYQSNLRIHPQ